MNINKSEPVYLFFVSSLLILALVSCGPTAEIAIKPNLPILPIVITLDTDGEISVQISYEIRTPLATIELSGGGSQELSAIRESEFYKNKHVLFVRVDDELTTFELVEGQEFDVHLENDEGYREVNLKHEIDGDIILELESINQPVVINPPNESPPTRIWPTSTPNKNFDTPQLVSGNCLPNKCHVQGFTGGLLVSAYGKTFGLFNSGQWLVENISDQEAQAVEHFNCATKPDLDDRVKWGFNIAYCRFHERGAKLGDPFDEGGSIEGDIFRSTSLGIEVNLNGRYGLNRILIKADNTWEFLN